jgi:hypothetical protein
MEYGWDWAGFAYVDVQRGAFTFTLKVTAGPFSPAENNYLNFGISVREGVVGNERHVSLKWQNAFADTNPWAHLPPPHTWRDLATSVPGRKLPRLSQRDRRLGARQALAHRTAPAG